MAFLGRILGNYADQSFENMVPSGTSATALPRKAYQWTLGFEIYPPGKFGQSTNPNDNNDASPEEETSMWDDAKAWGEEAMFGADPPDPNKFQDVGSLLKRASLVPQSVQLPQTTIDQTLMNQYNRKRVVQTGIQFSPVTVTFYDTRDNPITLLIMQYLNYYFNNFRVSHGGQNKDLSNTGVKGTAIIDKSTLTEDTYEKVTAAAESFGYHLPNYETLTAGGQAEGKNKFEGQNKYFFRRIFINKEHGASSSYVRKNTPIRISHILYHPVITDISSSDLNYSDNGVITYSITFAYENWSVYDHGDAKNSSSLYDTASDYFSDGEEKTAVAEASPYTPPDPFAEEGAGKVLV